MEAVEGKCQGLVLCYTDVSNEAGRYNYLPFSDVHRRTPSLWVGAEDGAYLSRSPERPASPCAATPRSRPTRGRDTIVATLPGPSDEVVFLTTQTDGPNECNENGGLGVLALATYAAKLPKGRRNRTLVCSPAHRPLRRGRGDGPRRPARASGPARAGSWPCIPR